MPRIGLNFQFNSGSPNFTRDSYTTLENMSKVTNRDLDIGHIVYCEETNKHYKYIGNSKFLEFVDKTPDNYTSNYTIGGLAENTNIENKTALEVLDIILKPEYAPKWTDATISLTPSPIIKECGSLLPTSLDYTITGNPAKAGNVLAVKGIPNITMNDGEFITTAPSQPSIITIKATRSDSPSVEQVVTNKGNATRKTANNDTTLLVNATTNANIDENYYIKSILNLTATSTISVVYAIYASSIMNGILTKQPLTTSKTNVELTLKGGNINLNFAIVGNCSKIMEYNNISGKFDINCTNNYSGTNINTIQLPNGENIIYLEYTRSLPSGEDIKIQITFS